MLTEQSPSQGQGFDSSLCSWHRKRENGKESYRNIVFGLVKHSSALWRYGTAHFSQVWSRICRGQH
jgi:hypothetical protein